MLLWRREQIVTWANLQIEALNRERILLDEKKKVACEGHPEVEAHSAGLTAGGTTGGYTAGQVN